MATFIGDIVCRVDVKGRIMLPSAFKKQMPQEAQETFVVKKDIFEQCLVLYPLNEWERQNKIIRATINPYKKEHNRFLRNFYRGAAELLLDNNNRMLIPKRLLEEVGILREVVLAGQDSKIEIWPKEIYDGAGAGQDEFASLAEKIMGGNLNDPEK
jgi:MraZ protein